MKKTCHHQVISHEEILFLLKNAGISRTKIKIDILNLISKAHTPISVNELHAKLNEDCNISTVFRAVTQLREKHLISDVILNDGFTRYEFNHGPSGHHHHHIKCKNCERVETLDDCDLEMIEKKLRDKGYQFLEHRLEFTGLCHKCAKSAVVNQK